MSAHDLAEPAQWTDVHDAFGRLGHEELTRRNRELARLLSDDGVSYNVVNTADGGGGDNRWRLDVMPLVLSSEQWATIERGVIQRAELLSAVLEDLYGPRELIRRGLVAPEVVYGHDGFLRECDQIRIPGDQQLFTYAADLARGPDGSLVVLGDRAEAPSGAGYALENRIVVSRVVPSLYRDSQVHRLAPFFRSLRAALQAAAPAGVDDPRIVVMSPGPRSETAFEHAFLASYLGYSLVEGSDLTVREGRVWLRSLGTLEPVHVILRRVDAVWCDPLELHPYSRLGVPGLVEAARRGTVSIVNPLGSGVLENPALMVFLPALAEHLLGQSLHLESVPTFWCGHETSRHHVLARLSELVVRPLSRVDGRRAFFGCDASAGEIDDMRRAIEARPYAYVGQALLHGGSVPTVSEDGMSNRRTVLRAFAVTRHGSYAAMPGGLTRVAPDDTSRRISNQAGALSKDTWVLSSEPEQLTSFWLQSGPMVAPLEPAASISARAAEQLFWLGRYAERAEDVVRLLRAVYDRRNDFERGTNPAGTECLQILCTALTHVTTTYPGFVGEGADAKLAAPGDELRSLLVDARRAGSLAYAVASLVDSALSVRDQMSSDTWIMTGVLQRELAVLAGPMGERRTALQGALGTIMQSLLAFAGLSGESMVRDPGWRFMDVGRRLERGLQMVALLRWTMSRSRSNATDSLLLESVLVASESIITYRRRYRSHAQTETLLDLLLFDPGNPRSLAYQLDRLGEDVALLPRPDGHHLGDDQRLVLEATTALRLADPTVLARTDAGGDRPELVALCDRLADLMSRTADAVDRIHFTHLLPQRTMASMLEPPVLGTLAP